MTNIDKPVTKYKDIDILLLSGDAFSLGSAVVVVVKHGNAAIVHTDLDKVLSLAMFVCWGVCTVWPASGRQNHIALGNISFFLKIKVGTIIKYP